MDGDLGARAYAFSMERGSVGGELRVLESLGRQALGKDPFCSPWLRASHRQGELCKTEVHASAPAIVHGWLLAHIKLVWLAKPLTESECGIRPAHVSTEPGALPGIVASTWPSLEAILTAEEPSWT